jgi:N-acetylneuraminic acid mutarotase
LNDPFEGKRAYSTAVYTGNTGDAAGKILIFGGCSGPANICINDYESVLEYQLNTKTWSVKRSAKSPVGRSQHHAQMTSKGMLIWGGISDRAQSGRGESLNSGGVYDPKTETWTEMPTHDAPSPRRFATAVWTGTENPTLSNDEKLIVFGGCDKQQGEYCPTTYEDGGVFDLDSFTWRKIKKSPFRARARHIAVWTGESMFVWGGLKGSSTLIDGALFTFTWDQDSRSLNETWNIVSSIVPEGRYDHSAVWAGDRVLIWGGVKSIGEYAYGMREYHLPSTRRPRGTWRTPVTAAAPVGRKLHSAHWIDDSFFVWGGTSLKRSYLYSGGRFFPKVSP